MIENEKPARNYAAEIALQPLAEWRGLINAIPPSPRYDPPEAIRELVRAHLVNFKMRAKFAAQKKAAEEASFSEITSQVTGVYSSGDS